MNPKTFCILKKRIEGEKRIIKGNRGEEVHGEGLEEVEGGYEVEEEEK
jgi:hypothetical protein